VVGGRLTPPSAVRGAKRNCDGATELVFAGFKLGSWVGNQKGRWNSLSRERRHRLEELPGWALDARTAYWEEGFRRLQEYADQHGHTRVPQKYVIDDYRLGAWLNTQRTNWSKLSDERRQRLSQIPGWALNAIDAQWEEGFNHLLAYVAETGSALVPSDYILDGFRLGQWVTVQRRSWESLSDERRQRLAKLPGWAESARDAWWEAGFRRLEEYVQKFGHGSPPQSYTDDDGFRLGAWVHKQRQSQAKGKLSADRRMRLSKVRGWGWTPRTSATPRR
jgi:hypothetical protein